MVFALIWQQYCRVRVMILHNLVDLLRRTKNVSYRTEMNQDMRVVRQVKLKRIQLLKYLSWQEVSKVR